jgi:hypothetical protein
LGFEIKIMQFLLSKNNNLLKTSINSFTKKPLSLEMKKYTAVCSMEFDECN